ncbi:MAG: molybdopterin-dependent oxidoreductase [Actinomycetota bacterium]
MTAMAGRRTNLALLVFLAVSVGTGGLAFALGSGWGRWAVVVHGAAALGIVLLAPWKSVIARKGLRRGRPGSWASLIFSALVAIALLAGVGHGTGLLRTLGGGITSMQVHVGAALASIPFAIWHVLARKVRPRRTDLSRRTLLRAGLLAGAALAAYGGLAGLVRFAGLPGRRRRFTGSYATGSFRPEEMPVTQWLFDHVPRLDGEAWRLSLRHRGRDIGTRSLEDLEGMSEPVRATIDCTGGWFAEQDWQGVRLDTLLPDTADARSILARSATGYSRRFPVVDASRLWLVTRVGGPALSEGHGYPARIVAPGRRGFWWVKWVVALEVSDTPWWWQPPYPLQ